MSSLYQAYLKALDLAINRDLRVDTFVIKKTVNYIQNALDSMAEVDQQTLKDLHQKIIDYLDSEELVEIRMDMMFGETEYLKKNIFDINIQKISSLKKRIEELIT
jgi:hypothetical protein